jgi:CBS-domain-containing membrane protein
MRRLLANDFLLKANDGLLKWLREDPAHPTSHREKVISTVGGFFGILAVCWISCRVLDVQGAALMVGSMGASAVLLFAVPHGSLSQPWPVLGGHVLSAAVGVTVARWVPDPMLAAALAVSLSIAVMYYLRCIHPPGGGTALVAVVGGAQVHALGYGYLVEPVLLNVSAILIVAVLVNYPFAWRRYPLRHKPLRELLVSVPPPRAGLASHADHHAGEKCVIAHSDLVYALSQLDSFIDVSEEDLLQIYALAVRASNEPAVPDAAPPVATAAQGA